MQLKVKDALVEARFFVGDAHRLCKRDEVGWGDADTDTEQLSQLCLHLHNGADAEQMGAVGGAESTAFGAMQGVVMIGNHLFDVVVRHVAAQTEVEILSQGTGIECRNTCFHLVDPL